MTEQFFVVESPAELCAVIEQRHPLVKQAYDKFHGQGLEIYGVSLDNDNDKWLGAIREHGMGAIVNGIVLHGLTRAYGGTFFVFADYMRGAVRLSAVMNIPSIFVWTHDSIGVGEDGPTHQPIEHLWAYRAIPGLDIVRPADANETSAAWKGILERRDGGPAGIILSRQNLPVLEGTSAEGVRSIIAASSPRLAQPTTMPGMSRSAAIELSLWDSAA